MKEALHVSMEPSSILCREEEQKRVFEFCKACVEQDKAGSLYVCGCPGTGKTLSIDKVKVALVTWAQDVSQLLLYGLRTGDKNPYDFLFFLLSFSFYFFKHASHEVEQHGLTVLRELLIELMDC